jgi:hypothetical protein
MTDENGDNDFDGYSTRTTIKEEIQTGMSSENMDTDMQHGQQGNGNDEQMAEVKTEITDEARGRSEKDREGKKDRDKEKERKKKSKRSSRDRSRSKERERKRSLVYFMLN